MSIAPITKINPVFLVLKAYSDFFVACVQKFNRVINFGTLFSAMVAHLGFAVTVYFRF